MPEIKHLINDSKGACIYEVDGKKMAERVYVMAGEKKMIIEHTEVDESLKGQGIGKQLQASLVEFVRDHDIKVIPLCPFANATFKRMKEWQDVLV
jgi:predicted GNAT family acetyltransferase